MKKLIFPASMSLLLAMTCCKTNKLEYPEAPHDDTVDNYFGHEVPDPFRPLEDDTAAATLAWVEAENKVTQDYLSQIPFRTKIHDRLEQLNNYPKIGMPWKEQDGRYYEFRNNGLQNQAVLYRMEKPGEDGEIFLDPNTLSEDGTVALKNIFFSADGKYMAYSISRSGSDWEEIFVLDTATGEQLDDHIEWSKFSGAAWQGDGFYYSTYPRPTDGKEFSSANENHLVYYHKMGTPQADDRLAYSDESNPLHFHSAWLPENEQYLFIVGAGEGFGNSLIFKDLKKPSSAWVTVEPSQEYPIEPIDVIDGYLYFTTTYNAPRGQLMRTPLSRPGSDNWETVIPEGEGVLQGIYEAGDKFIASYIEDVATHAYIYNRDGSLVREISLPEYVTASFSTSPKSDEVFYSASSMHLPATIYIYDMNNDESQVFRATEINGFNPDDYVTHQVFYTSADGTRIPMSLTYRKDLKPDGNNPVYLYGYGGFDISLTPSFSPQRVLWLENGGIYAQANLRGGGEYGEAWHQAGTQQNKINVFNDFIAAAEYLIDEGWTTPELLTIEGGSNGGLLVGATVNMRPDLFKVAIPRVGVMDMMRYHLFTIGWNWAPDYGTSADSPEMAEYLLSYSPLHTIKNDGTPYPAILVTTADHDDRVVPAHSFKYAATLQQADTGDAPKLIRIDSKAGHGSGKPVSKVIDEWTDLYSFTFYNLGRQPK